MHRDLAGFVPNARHVARFRSIGQQTPSHVRIGIPRRREAPWHARDDGPAGWADGAQRLCHRRDDSALPDIGRRCTLPRRTTVSWSLSLISWASPRPSSSGAHSRTGSASRSSPGGQPLRDFRAALRVRGAFPADRRSRSNGRVRGGDPRARRGDGPRPVRGRGHGAGDEPRLHGLHARAGPRAQHRTGDPPFRAVAGDLPGACRLCDPDARLVVAASAGDLAPGVPPIARLARNDQRDRPTIRDLRHGATHWQ